MSTSQLRKAAEATAPLAFTAETSDKISTMFVELLDDLNRAGPTFKGCAWQTSDRCWGFANV